VPPPPVPGPAPDEKIAAPRPAPPRRTGPLPSTPTVLAPGSSSRPTEEQAIAAITRALGAHKNIDSMIMSRTNGSVSWLNLSNLDATDADLANIRAFGNLKYLFLIGGKITDTGLAYLAEVPTLEGLYISQNKVTGVGLQALRNLPRLSRLDFSPQAGFKAEYLEPIASCKELENVTIESYKLSADALRPLRQLPRLRDLGLKGSGVTDAEMSLIAEFTNLEELDLQGCPVTGKGLQQLRNLNKLTKLNVSYNHSLHDEDLKELKGCRSLGRINIGETHISDAGLLYLVPLPKLREVAVGKSGSKANEKSLLEKGERPQETNRITDKGRAAFKKERPDVEIVE